MKKTFIIKLSKLIIMFPFKLIAFILGVLIRTFLNPSLYKEIKERKQWEREYDQHVADVTSRKFSNWL